MTPALVDVAAPIDAALPKASSELFFSWTLTVVAVVDVSIERPNHALAFDQSSVSAADPTNAINIFLSN